ncbi:ComF family protein [Croceicoccus ponticola]|uniref:ComF family protein n=1 Tax=Croceicoccus ponticola TaxID=2217664 RepID=A0A437H2I2_9SPHN|nr:ComF family protein [Croceicoccus ponticola]RVQ69776.1 ComF family protein [Croceicoccus ponticola]
MSLRLILAPIVDFVFPPRCPACGDAIAGGAPAGDDALCADCWTKLKLPGEPSCAACQRPFGADHLGVDALCGRCLTQLPCHDGIVAATIYGDISRQMVLDLKHAGRIALAGPMGRTLAARIGDRTGPDTIVVPVPLHRWRLWKRGYNQSALMAKAIAKARGWAHGPDVLRRVRATPSLGGLNPAERTRALMGAIAIAPRWRDRIRGRSVLLVDDVLTSGATSDACVRALKAAGAGKVLFACYARVIDGDAVVALNAGQNGVAQTEAPGANDPGRPA